MAKILTSDVDAMSEENAELKAGVRACISELESANKRMAQRRVRIDKLKAETRAMLDELKVA